MKNVWIITLSTIREALVKKVFLFFLIITALVLLGLIIAFSVVNTEAIVTAFNPAKDEAILNEVVFRVQLLLIAPLSSLCILLAIFASSSFVPGMMEKGTIDLYLSKPISRNQLLLGKYLGGVTVVFINISTLILGVWFIVSAKFGYWDPSTLSVIIIITFTFAVLYSVIVLFGVISQNSIFGMMIAYFIFLILSPLLLFLKDNGAKLFENDFIQSLVNGLYYVIPKTAELTGDIMTSFAEGKSMPDYQPIITSFLFLLLIMFYSILLFKKKDF